MQTDGMEAGRQAVWYLQFRCFIPKMLYVQFKGQDAQGRPVSQSMRHEFLLHIMKSKTSKFLITCLIEILI